MERLTLNARTREKVGSSAARAARRAGEIPAVVYRGGESSPISVERAEMLKFMRKTAGEQAIVNLQVQGDKERLALMKDFQTDPVRNELLHVDFFEVSLTEKIAVTVPLSLVGEPIGVKRDKGILQQSMREIEVECLPDSIPGHIELDLSALEIGDSIHVSDIGAPAGVEIISDHSDVVAAVIAPTVMEEAAPGEEVEVEAPELVKKGKKEEEEKAEGEKRGE